MLPTVRNGKKSPPTCPDCGCRLNVVSFASIMDAPAKEYADYGNFVHHFTGNEPDRDAQGHLCSLIGSVWSVKGKQNVRN